MAQTITALEVQKRNTDRVSVYLDGEFAFGLPAIEAARLRKGQSLSADEIAALRDIDAVSRAMDRALKLLARRPYSVAEIRRNLTSHDIAPGVIDEAIARLEHMGYVDDLAFARYWVENRERFKPRGVQALRYELRQRGIAASLIEQVLADFEPEDAAYRAAEGKVRSLRGHTRLEFKNKLGGFLARRGFKYAIARETVERFIAELEDQQPDFFAPDTSPDQADFEPINPTDEE